MTQDSPIGELAAQLLVAGDAERTERIAVAEAAALSECAAELGRHRQAVAADALLAIDAVAADRGIRKQARRELHRLRAAGIEPSKRSEPAPPTPAGRLEGQATAKATLAWATEFDAAGARALWIVGERPLGGVWLATLVLHSVTGLGSVDVSQTTRKRVLRDVEQRRSDQLTWVTLPADYALKLVAEAVALTRAADRPLDRSYTRFHEIFQEFSPPDRALIYDSVSLMAVKLHPEWLAESTSLLDEPEVGGWTIPVTDEYQERAYQAAQSTSATLLVPGQTPDELAQRLIEDASRSLLSSDAVRALKRQLEETALLLEQTGRATSAQRAVAAAVSLSTNASAEVPLRDHPFVRGLLAMSLSRAVRARQIGSRSAADILFDLLERTAVDPVHRSQGGATSSGALILPR